ncbi:hypothetical protein GYH30_047588 [Glycine max]|nr:hypothetical protein GYH30_047588 [Glycine max]
MSLPQPPLSSLLVTHLQMVVNCMWTTHVPQELHMCPCPQVRPLPCLQHPPQSLYLKPLMKKFAMKANPKKNSSPFYFHCVASGDPVVGRMRQNKIKPETHGGATRGENGVGKGYVDFGFGG